MKKLIIICVMFVPFLINAQSKDEQQVSAKVEQLRLAMINGDRAALENLVAEKLSYGHSGGYIDNKKEFVEKLASGASDFVSIVLTEQTISVSEKVAIVRHILTAKTNDGGKPADVHIRILLVWQKQKGSWKLLARQAVKIT